MKKRTHIYVGLHQEDERCEGTSYLRPYLDIGISVLKKKEIDGEVADYELINMREMVEARQCELDLFLDPGKYIILPK